MTAGGVGYELAIPLSVFEKLPRMGGDVELLTYQVVREDDLMLFGFLQEGERELFGKLLGASGVGPRLALALMSTLTPVAAGARHHGPGRGHAGARAGVGRKTAERIALELGDKLEGLALRAGPSVKGAAAQEAVGALVALGYSSADASTAAVRRSIEETGRKRTPRP
jgi:holliday junction DNA helicase RuvA